MSEVKLLTAGYGAGNGPGMTLLTTPFVPVHPDLEDVLWNYSCNKKYGRKIRQCLENSGRYDCWVQAGWIYCQYYEVKKDLADIGVRMIITSVPEEDRWAIEKGKIRIETV